MFALLGAGIFCGAAAFSLIVIVQMVRGYMPLIEAVLRHEPLPRAAVPAQAYVVRRRRVAPVFTPSRLERVRAAA